MGTHRGRGAEARAISHFLTFLNVSSHYTCLFYPLIFTCIFTIIISPSYTTYLSFATLARRSSFPPIANKKRQFNVASFFVSFLTAPSFRFNFSQLLFPSIFKRDSCGSTPILTSFLLPPTLPLTSPSMYCPVRPTDCDAYASLSHFILRSSYGLTSYFASLRLSESYPRFDFTFSLPSPPLKFPLHQPPPRRHRRSE